MARRIELDIELTKIDKRKITEKNGRKFYKMTAIETPDGKYGQWMIVEKQSNEEREARTKGTILGNGKNYGWGEGTQGSSGASPTSKAPSTDDLPY